jgi:hypothetical protein
MIQKALFISVLPRKQPGPKCWMRAMASPTRA